MVWGLRYVKVVIDFVNAQSYNFMSVMQKYNPKKIEKK